MPIADIFPSQPDLADTNPTALTHLASLLTRTTNVALSFPPSLHPSSEMSLSRALGSKGRLTDGPSSRNERDSTVGSMLEFQLGILEGMRGREGVHELTNRTLQEALACYEVERFPIRRARVLARQIQQMGFSMGQGEPSRDGCHPVQDVTMELDTLAGIEVCVSLCLCAFVLGMYGSYRISSHTC